MKKITPFRQIAALYDAIINIGLGTREIARQATNISNTLEMLSEAINNNSLVIAQSLLRAYPPPSIIPPAIYDINGLRLLLDTTSIVDRMVVENKSWEPEQIKYLTKISERFRGENNPIFLDIGSYWGYYSLILAKTGIFNKIYAFDADTFNYSQLCSNIFLNKLDQLITPHNLAVSDQDGLLNIGISKQIEDGNRGAAKIITDEVIDARKSQAIKSIALDNFLKIKDSSILIKMDVEAHEEKALLGMRNLIKNNRVILQIEIYEEQRTSVTPILELIGLKKIHEIYPDFYYSNFI